MQLPNPRLILHYGGELLQVTLLAQLKKSENG